MRKIIYAMLACCIVTAAYAQETDVNQYGQKVTANELKAQQQDGILVLKSDLSKYKVWFDIRVQGDAAVYFGNNPDFDPIGNGLSMRRTRFAVKAQLDNNWYGEIDTDWTSGTPELKDAYLAFTGVKDLEIQAGNYKENFSLQRNTTSRYLQFMERPMVTSLAPSRHMGLMATLDKPLFWVSAGVFGPELKSAEEQTFMEDNNKDFGRNEGLSYTGKLVLRPLYKKQNGSLHIGGAFSYRNPKTTGTEGWAVGRFSSRNSTSINRKKYLDTDAMPGLDHEIVYTAELAGHYKALRYEAAYIARTAYFNQTVNPIGAQKADGWYVQAGYLLFGGHQNYDSNGAKYTRVNRGKSWGDVELCARYEYCNFNTGDYWGGSAEAYALGLNFYLSNNVKLVLNYQYNNNDRYANGKGKLLVGYDASGKPTKDFTKVVAENGKAGVDYSMIALRFEVAF